MIRKIRVLIADDDIGMRLVLKKIIIKNDVFELVGEASDGDEAVRLSDALKPDVVFLDIEMPCLTGLECAKAICEQNPDIAIIFATAHDEFMSDAFEVYAYDYMIKPFKVDRVLRTLSRLESAILRPESPIKHVTSGKLTIKNRDGLVFVKTDEIIFIERVERTSFIYTTNGEFHTSDGLNELEERLDPHLFMRCHRSFIINIAKVQKAVPFGRWTYSLGFSGIDKQALITHDKMDELQEIL